MTHTQHPTQEDAPVLEVYRTPPHFKWGAVAAIVVLLMLLLMTWFSHQWAGKESAPQSPMMAASKADAAVQQAEVEQALAAEQERRTLAEARRGRVLQLAKDAHNAINNLAAEFERWDKNVAPLRNKRACPLAADAMYFMPFDDLLKRAPQSREDLAEARGRIGALTKPSMEANEKGTFYSPSDEVMGELRAETGALRKALRAWREVRTAVESLLHAARASGKTTALSVAEAVQNRKTEQVERRAAAKKAEIEREERAHRERLARLEAERRRAEQEAEIAQKQREVRERNERAERDALVARARAVKTDGRFDTFLARGEVRFATHRDMQYQGKLRPPGPVSYKRLVKYGVLNNFKVFAEARTNRGIGRHNDRPTRPYPTSDAGWKQWREDFELFRKLAPVLRDLGHLRP